MTPLLPTFEKRIDDATAVLISRQVDPWLFMRQGLSLQRCDGRFIAYSGIEFDGSPRLVFWAGYIEPFLQDLVVKELAAARAMAKERDVDGALVLTEVRGLLCSAFNRVYARMAEIDQKLRGAGYPRSVAIRPVDKEVSDMLAFLERHVEAELQMWKPRRKLEVWYEQNKFTVWALGAAIPVVGLVAKLLGG